MVGCGRGASRQIGVLRFEGRANRQGGPGKDHTLRNNNRPGGAMDLVTISQIANPILQTLFIAVIGLGVMEAVGIGA